jgi:hypothetical protein
MGTRVRLSDGIEFVVHTDLEAAHKAWSEALIESQMLEIRNKDDDARVLVNPHQVLFLEDE